jgi:hypothetical protein
MFRFPAPRWLFPVLTLCVVLGAVSAEYFEYYHFIKHHCCAGGYFHGHAESKCSVCLRLAITRNILKSLGPVKLAAFFAFFADLGPGYVKNRGFSGVLAFSPVALKVRINS